MTPIELRERIAQWEDLHTDFKGALGHPDSLAKDLVCFANTDGGQIIVGVADDHTVVGVEDTDAVHRTVDNVAYNNCEPPITVVQEIVELDGCKVVVINVPKGDQRPYRTNRGRYYTRTTSGCRDASREELLRLFQAAESLYYDETPLLRLSLGDLDLRAVDDYLEARGLTSPDVDVRRVLASWRLMRGDHPTIAGLLLFGRAPQIHLPFAQIKAARIPGVDLENEPSDRKDLDGTIFEIIEGAQRFLRAHLRVPHSIKGFEPERRPELPEEALREGIVNALVHRDYTVRAPLRLFVFDDRVEIHTPGKPPNTVDEEAMRAGVHVPRNPHLYTRLSDAGMVTGIGTGIRRIFRLVRDAVGRDPDIDISESEIVLTIPRPSLEDVQAVGA